MANTKTMNIPGHEEVIFYRDSETGLTAIVAIHDTTLGPGAGGTRMWQYETEQDALTDVLRLSRAMTYKAAAADLNFGGAKAVIIGDPYRDKSEALLTSYGKFVESLQGRFLTGEDVGTSAEDMQFIARQTRYISCSHPGDLDTTWLTAYGVLRGIQASVKARLGEDNLEGITVAVQGLGKVGNQLARLLAEKKTKLFVTDIRHQLAVDLAGELGAEVIKPEAVYDLEVDVFSPCALGAVLNLETIRRLKCAVVAGAANNQLADDQAGEQLWKHGMLYAPDYVINAGGLISALYEMRKCDLETVKRLTSEIYNRLQAIFEYARAEGIPTNVAADRLVEEKLRRARE